MVIYTKILTDLTYRVAYGRQMKMVSHKDMDPHTQSHQDYYAIGITWYVARNRHQFRESSKSKGMASLIALRDTEKITAVLPFHHRPLKVKRNSVGNPWTDYWVIVLNPGIDPEPIWRSIENSLQSRSNSDQEQMLRAEVLRPQPGLDMYDPRMDGAKSEPKWHWIEYAVSLPESGTEYYQDQYLFSAPVIQHFWKADLVKRCIGFEHKYYLENDSSLPEWDVIHITGFNPLRLAQIGWHLLRFMPTFNNLARKVGHKSALEVFKSWDAQRVKYQILAVQDQSYSLRPLRSTSLTARR